MQKPTVTVIGYFNDKGIDGITKSTAVTTAPIDSVLDSSECSLAGQVSFQPIALVEDSVHVHSPLDDKETVDTMVPSPTVSGRTLRNPFSPQHATIHPMFPTVFLISCPMTKPPRRWKTRPSQAQRQISSLLQQSISVPAPIRMPPLMMMTPCSATIPIQRWLS